MAAYGVMREECGGVTVHSPVSCHTYIWKWDEANKYFTKIITILRGKNIFKHSIIHIIKIFQFVSCLSD